MSSLSAFSDITPVSEGIADPKWAKPARPLVVYDAAGPVPFVWRAPVALAGWQTAPPGFPFAVGAGRRAPLGPIKDKRMMLPSRPLSPDNRATARQEAQDGQGWPLVMPRSRKREMPLYDSETGTTATFAQARKTIHECWREH